MDPSPPFSFDDWLRAARPRLLRLALSRLRDAHEAEDVVQETVLAVWRRHQAGGIEDLDAYANRAVWQNSIRRKTRRRDWEELENAELEGAARTDPDVEAWLEAQALEEAIDGLLPVQAAVVRLRFYAGMNFREMGEALSIGLNTAASRTRYALKALRRSLESAAEGAQEENPTLEEQDHGKGARKRKGTGKRSGKPSGAHGVRSKRGR